MIQAWSHRFLNLRHNSELVNLVISSTGRLQEKGIFRFLKNHEKIAFYPNWKMFLQKFIAWNIGSDRKLKILTLWALLGASDWHKLLPFAFIEPWSVNVFRTFIFQTRQFPRQLCCADKCLCGRSARETWHSYRRHVLIHNNRVSLRGTWLSVWRCLVWRKTLIDILAKILILLILF